MSISDNPTSVSRQRTLLRSCPARLLFVAHQSWPTQHIAGWVLHSWTTLSWSTVLPAACLVLLYGAYTYRLRKHQKTASYVDYLKY